MHKRLFAVCIITCVVLGPGIIHGHTPVLPSAALAAAPPHDNFSAAKTIGSLPHTDGPLSTLDATTEEFEPTPCGSIGRTVWYNYTPTTNVVLIADTIGSDYDTVLAVHTGPYLATLALVGCNDDIAPGNVRSRVQFSATAGVTYRFQVGGYNGASGSLVFNLTALPPPHDNFAAAKFVTGPPFTDTVASTTGATTEVGEPLQPCVGVNTGKTVWYRLAPAVDYRVQVDTVGSSYDTVLAVYTGSSVGSLTLVACNDDIAPPGNRQSMVELPVTPSAGSYYIQVGGYNGASGSLVLNVTELPPPHDNFSSAKTIGSLSYTDGPLSTFAATKEEFEPTPCGSIGKTVWYNYTPPTNMTLMAETVGSDYDTVLAAHTGPGFGALTLVACNDDINPPTIRTSRVTFAATAGVTYRFQVGGFNGAGGVLRFSLRGEMPTPTPTATATRTRTATATRTPTATATRTFTATSTATRTPTVAPTSTPTPTAFVPPTGTLTPTATVSHTGTPTPAATSTPTPTPTISPTPIAPPDCPELLSNNDFETGTLPPWGTAGPTGMGPGHDSPHGSWLGGADSVDAELWQEVAIPEGSDAAILSFWWLAEGAVEQPGDVLEVYARYDEQVDLLHALPAEGPLEEWRQESVDLTQYAGQTVSVTFHARTDGEVPTTFRLDDANLRACQYSTRLILPQRDAYVAEDAGSSNFGAETELRTTWRPDAADETASLIWFDLAGMLPEADLSAAHLSLVVTDVPEGELASISIHQVTEPWEEMAVTWNTQPAYVADPLVWVEAGSDPYRHVFWDITELVRGWIADPGSNHGLVVRIQPDAGGATRIFGSRESDEPPILTLAYNLPPIDLPEPTPTPIPDHVTLTLPATDSAYLRWDGYEGRNMIREDPGPILLSYDVREYVAEARLLQFDLGSVPGDREVYEARLEVYLQGGENPEPVRIIAEKMDVPWTADDASWTTAYMMANEETWAPRGVAWVDLEAPRWVSFDVTRHVKRWLGRPDADFGLRLVGTDRTDDPWSRQFAGLSAGSTAPRLVIRHATEPLALELSSSGLPDYKSTHCPAGFGHLLTLYGLRYNWKKVIDMAAIPTPFTGTVERAYISHKEWPATHWGHDLCLDIPKNATNAWAYSTSNPTGMEIEWEHRVWPKWAWPADGDEVIIFGNLVVDCPHDYGRTEIHPPRGVVAIREDIATDMSKLGGLGYNLLNRADIFFSNQLTPAHWGGFIDPPVGSNFYPSPENQDYEFDLHPPANRAEGAQLVWKEVHHSHSYGTSVKPIVSLVGSGPTDPNAYLHVRLPYNGKSGKLHTATSIEYGWSRTDDPDLRAFRVEIHGIDIYDNAEPWTLGDGEWYVWVNVNDQWFDLRSAAPGIADAGDQYYPTHPSKRIVANVIVPDTADGKIKVRATGYESDCLDSLYGIQGAVGTDYLGLMGGCYLFGGDNDEIGYFSKTWTAASGFVVGDRDHPQKFNGPTDKDGEYGLVISIEELTAPKQFQFRSMTAGVAGAAITVDGVCGITEYTDESDEAEIEMIGTVEGNVTARAAYDKDALYVCFDDINASAFNGQQREAVVYLDGGSPSQLKSIPGLVGWVGRTDDLRIAYQTAPSDTLTAHTYDLLKGWFKKPVPPGLVTAQEYVRQDRTSIEFKIDKSLIPRGPWSKTVPEQSLLHEGVGALLAIERKVPDPMRWDWPETGLPTDPRLWGRMLFEPGCPVEMEVSRVGPELKDTIGQTTMVKVKYSIFDHSRCDLVNGKLVSDVSSSYWTPVETCKMVGGVPPALQCGIGGGGTYDKTSGEITWDLPSTLRAAEFSFGVRLEDECRDWPPLLGSLKPCVEFDTGFTSPNVESLSGLDAYGCADVCSVETPETAVNVPDLRQWWEGFPLPPVPPWFRIFDPVIGGLPPEVLLKVQNADPFERRVLVKSMPVQAGLRGADPAANQELDFSGIDGTWYTVPANGAVSVLTPLTGSAPLGQQLAAIDTGSVAVEVSHPDGGGPPQVAVRQVVPYVSLTPGEDNVFPMTVMSTVREPGDLHLQPIIHCLDWEVWVEPDTIPAEPGGASSVVDVHVRPPAGRLLGSGCPVDLVAVSDAGEFAGYQRILDLPPVQASPDQPPIASSQIELEPAQPEPGQEVRVCAIVRNRADAPIDAEVLLGISDRLSTAPEIAGYSSVPVTVPAGELTRACGDPFTWPGDRSLQAIIRQTGYQDQVIRRHVARIRLPDGIPSEPILLELEVRNPLATATELSLSRELVGLPGWDAEMPGTVMLGPGAANVVEVRLLPPAPGTHQWPGDDSRLEIWTETPEGQAVGGAWIHVVSNAMAVDAIPGGEVDSTATGAVGHTLDVDVRITDPSEPYAGYDSVLSFDPAVVAAEKHTYLAEGEFDFCADAGIGAAGVSSGCAGSMTTSFTGSTDRITFRCLAQGATTLHLVTEGEAGTFTSTLGGTVIPTRLRDALVECGSCVDRIGDTICDDPVNDPDDDGCTAAEEAALGSVFDGTASGWYDVYDVPVPAKADAAGANGTRDKMIDIRDVLAVLFYAFAEPSGACGDNPNANGVDYDCVKGVDLDGDTDDDVGTSHGIKEGVKYDRSPGLDPDPVTGIDPAGPPDDVIDVRDVLATLAQAFVVDCTG